MSQVIKYKSLDTFATGVSALELPFDDSATTRRSGAFLKLAQLEDFLSEALTGMDVSGMPLKTRSKFVRDAVISSLGYATPKSYRKGVIFAAQNADIYVQKANNLQIWNEKIEPSRRYLVVVLAQNDTVAGVRAFTGKTLATWSRTGTLTAKYQARLKLVFSDSVKYHVCGRDTERTVQFTGPVRFTDPCAEPAMGSLLSIEALAEKLATLVGTKIPYVSAVDDKKRSSALLGAVGKVLGYAGANDTATFPDLPCQMLAVKLQTSGTIDLGQTWPSSDSPLNFQTGRAKMLRRRDARFAVFYGTRVGNNIRIDKLVVTPGARFWDVFEPLKGQTRNTKLQVKLPAHAMAV